jgi:hypothetical protein
MKRLFISQPMRDKSNAEILAERNKAIEVASKQLNEEVEVIDSFFKDSPALTNPLLCLAKSLELLATADIAYFADGWEQAKGCRIERLCAEEYNIPVIIN